MQSSRTGQAGEGEGHRPRVGCVSYLNSKPLIEGLDGPIRFDVPARLLGLLERGEVDVALCPVIDYFRSPMPLSIVPASGICCNGPTMTVRLFSKVPIERIDTVHADSDSHSSVALLRVLLDRMHGLRPRLVDYHVRDAALEHETHEAPQAMLLIGDKVVTNSPKAIEYPHQLDLGEAWHRLTGLPFMFATWIAADDADLGDLPKRLAAVRQRNAGRIDDIVERYADAHGWPAVLARDYLTRILHYRVGPDELEAAERFGRWAAELGIIDHARPLTLWQSDLKPQI